MTTTKRTLTEEQDAPAVSFIPGEPIPEPPEPDTTPPTVTFTEPAQDARVALGTNLTFKFTAKDFESGIASVEWSRDGTNYTKLTTAATGNYSVAFTVDSRRTHTVWVRAKDKSPDVAGGNIAVDSRSIVGYDPNPPDLLVDSPTAEITDAAVSLVARARVGHPGSGIKSVSWNLGGMATGEAVKQGDTPDGFSRWTASISLPSRKVPAGGTTFTLTVRATNLDNVVRDMPVTFKAVDRTKPTLEVTRPGTDRWEEPGTIEGATVTLEGTASDGQDVSKLHGDIQSVAWSLNGGPFANVVPAKPGDWSAWTAEVRIPSRDEHLIVVRCVDAQGNESRVERTVVTALPFEVKDVGTRSYLKDLVDFATRRLKRSTTGPYLDHRLLAATFHQPFADLVTAAGDKATRPVHQARVAIEALREYLNPRPAAHWTFDEGTGTAVADASGNGVAGTLQGPVWGAGRLGQALRFDGIDDVVKLGKAGYADVVNNFTIAFWALPQATQENDIQATSGATGISGQRYAIDPRHGGILYGAANHVCAGVSVGTNGVGVYEHGNDYMPALLVHPAVLSAWTHVAVVYEEKTPKLYLNGTLQRTGLTSPKEYVHVNPEFLGGMNYGYYAGWLDDVRVYDRPLSAAEVANLVAPPPAGEIVWVEDAVPPGAVANVTNDAWTWVTAAPAPYSGTRSHQSNAVAGMHQHFFENAPGGLAVARGDRLFAYVYIDPANKPEEVMLQWYDGTWEHRAFWGKDAIAWGTPGTESRRYMGQLPADGQWVRLEVAASQVGLENRVVTGMSFALFGGRATWDRAGKVGAAAPLAAAEAEYRRAAYETLLRQLGTSYAEIRLARGAEPATREALATRFGIRLGTVTPDSLDRLFFEPDKVTEADLERLFGLEGTTRNPLDATALSEPELLTWQRELLRTQWRDADGVRAEPLIDPDLTGPEDIKNRVASDPAFALWTERRTWVDGKLAELRTKRQSKSSLLEGLDLIANEVLAPDTLAGMATDRERGLDLGEKLAGKGLSVPGFDSLVRTRRLAVKGTVLPTEWDEVYAILTQALKVRAYRGWVDAEKARNVHLGPDFFVIRDGLPRLPAWRATEVARRAWERALQARLDQWHGTAAALRDAVATTEATTLPLLRDALVSAAGAGRTDIDPAEALTRRLAIDLKTGGELLTTRVDQAVETLQGILFSLRAGQFKERTADLGPNPASTWVLEQRANYKEEHFDLESRWMGSYDAWRAAMFAFLYPENLLLPSLREDTTPGSSEKDPTDAFRTLVGNLRGTTGLTPTQARSEAAIYLASLLADGSVPEALKSALRSTPPGWTRPFEITEQLDDAQLLARRSWLTGLWTNTAIQTAQAKTYLREVFYFVPVQLALQLHQSGEYLAALDWLQTVYAYNLPPDQRKIYEPLALDPASPQSR